MLFITSCRVLFSPPTPYGRWRHRATEINRNRKSYYDALAAGSITNDINDWLTYFGETIIRAQSSTLREIEFLVEKDKLLDKCRDGLNPRQEKVVLRMFAEGPDGFKGGMSAEKYISITRTSRQTADRDLTQLVDLGVLIRKGERKGTRYWLNITLDSEHA